MCPSTCALSLDTWVRDQIHLRTPPAMRTRSTTPRMAKIRFRFEPFWAGRNSALPRLAAGSPRAGRCSDTSGSIVVAMSSSLGRSAIGQLVQLPGAAHGAGQRHTSHARLEPLPRFIQLRLREAQPLGGDHLLLGGRAEVEPRRIDFGGDLPPQLVGAHARLLEYRLLLRDPPLAP